MAARTPMITTTIISSMSVKPWSVLGRMSEFLFMRGLYDEGAERSLAPPPVRRWRLLTARQLEGQNHATLAVAGDLVLGLHRVTIGHATLDRVALTKRDKPRALINVGRGGVVERVLEVRATAREQRGHGRRVRRVRAVVLNAVVLGRQLEGVHV